MTEAQAFDLFIKLHFADFDSRPRQHLKAEMKMLDTEFITPLLWWDHNVNRTDHNIYSDLVTKGTISLEQIKKLLKIGYNLRSAPIDEGQLKYEMDVEKYFNEWAVKRIYRRILNNQEAYQLFHQFIKTKWGDEVVNKMYNLIDIKARTQKMRKQRQQQLQMYEPETVPKQMFQLPEPRAQTAPKSTVRIPDVKEGTMSSFRARTGATPIPRTLFSDSDENRCQCLTLAGKQCSKTAKKGFKYCATHLNCTTPFKN